MLDRSLRYVKVIRSDYTGSMGKVHLGLNECPYLPDTAIIPTNQQNAKNGFYFSSKKDIWDELYDNYRICDITIPEDALVNNFHSWKSGSLYSLTSNKIMVHSITESIPRKWK